MGMARRRHGALGVAVVMCPRRNPIGDDDDGARDGAQIIPTFDRSLTGERART